MRRRSAAIRSRASRRSVSICDSPGPRVPMPPPEALEMRPQAAHAREVVLELGELDLQLALGGVRVPGEDVEDDRGAVDHRDAELLLQVALLARAELVVAGDEVRVHGGRERLDLLDLARAEIEVGVRLVALLDQLADDRHARRAEQLLELGEVALRQRADADRALLGAARRLCGARAGGDGAAVAGAIHPSIVGSPRADGAANRRFGQERAGRRRELLVAVAQLAHGSTITPSSGAPTHSPPPVASA